MAVPCVGGAAIEVVLVQLQEFSEQPSCTVRFRWPDRPEACHVLVSSGWVEGRNEHPPSCPPTHERCDLLPERKTMDCDGPRLPQVEAFVTVPVRFHLIQQVLLLASPVADGEVKIKVVPPSTLRRIHVKVWPLIVTLVVSDHLAPVLYQ